MTATAEPFERYYEPRIYEWIETQQESGAINYIFMIDGFDDWLGARNMLYEQQVLDDDFKGSHLQKVCYKALVYVRGQLERAGRFNTQPAASGISWGGIMGAVFQEAMTDVYAMSNLDPNKLPSMSYLENKIKASVFWDMFTRR
jgi:hypothetical protein